MSKLLTPMESAALDHPTQNHAQRGTVSERLRDNLFEIVSRPKRGPNLWKRRNRKRQWIEFTEAQALDFCAKRGA